MLQCETTAQEAPAKACPKRRPSAKRQATCAPSAPLPSTRTKTPLTRLAYRHALATAPPPAHRPHRAASEVGLLQQRLLVRPACGSDRAPKPLLPPLGVECLQRLLVVLSSSDPIAPWRRKKHPRKIKCSYACLRIRWHGSPCRPAVREVVRQLSVEGLRVRGPRAGFRSCAASAPGAAALPAAHAAVKPA